MDGAGNGHCSCVCSWHRRVSVSEAVNCPPDGAVGSAEPHTAKLI